MGKRVRVAIVAALVLACLVATAAGVPHKQAKVPADAHHAKAAHHKHGATKAKHTVHTKAALDLTQAHKVMQDVDALLSACKHPATWCASLSREDQAALTDHREALAHALGTLEKHTARDEQNTKKEMDALLARVVATLPTPQRGSLPDHFA